MSKSVWRAPVEVPLSDVSRRRTSPYAPLAEDILKRLERTQDGFALMYAFPDEKIARQYQTGAVKMIRKWRGSGTVRSCRRGTEIYVWRGPNWRMI